MGKLFQRGLVVGKFAPLHHGHERLLRRAEAACDTLFIVSYSRPELPGCGPERRERWLAELFPGARRLVVTEAWMRARLPGVDVPSNDDPDERAHRRFVGRLCREAFGVAVEVVFTSETYGDPFAAELTRFFREEDPGVPTVRHVLVDLERREVPVSGTAVRADVHGQRRFLSPAVYASFVERVCVLGGESSGKSTLAAALAERLGTAHVEEYGRELWEARGGKLAWEDMVEIGRVQVAREEAAARRARRFLICDTSPLTTLFYSWEMFGRVDPELERLAERRYGRVVLCAPDFAFVQDGTRQDAAFRARQHAWYAERLRERGEPWMVAAGSVEERVAAVAAALGGVGGAGWPEV